MLYFCNLLNLLSKYGNFIIKNHQNQASLDFIFFHKYLLYESHWILFCSSPNGENSPHKKIKMLYGAFTLNVKLVLNENLGGILGGTQCEMDHSSMLREC